MNHTHVALIGAAAALGVQTASGQAVREGTVGAQKQTEQPDELIWADEFNGSTLNPDNWEAQIGDGRLYGLPAGWGNYELQWYLDGPENLEVSDGTLKIHVEANAFGRPFTSARIRSKGLQEFRYGRVEARIRIPSAPGIWPAFWMLPTDSPYGGWASGGEIDIMESVDTADLIYGSLHHGGPWPQNVYTGGVLSVNQVPGVANWGDDFHVYSVEWEPDEIRWYVDGRLYSTKTTADWFSTEAPGSPRAPFDARFHLLLNVAVGGTFPSENPDPADFPKTMEVDWVRVYAPPQTPFGGSPVALPGRIEAERYDNGVHRQAHFDQDDINQGGQLRADGVDIEPSSDGGLHVGYIGANEWSEYTVDVQQAGLYAVETRVSSAQTGGLFRLEVNGVDGTGPIGFPATGSWDDWTSVIRTITLPAGTSVIRFANLATDAQAYNVSYFRFTLVAPAGLTAPEGEAAARPQKPANNVKRKR